MHERSLPITAASSGWVHPISQLSLGARLTGCVVPSDRQLCCFGDSAGQGLSSPSCRGLVGRSYCSQRPTWRQKPDVVARSIRSLGVLLSVLLTGETPFCDPAHAIKGKSAHHGLNDAIYRTRLTRLLPSQAESPNQNAPSLARQWTSCSDALRSTPKCASTSRTCEAIPGWHIPTRSSEQARCGHGDGISASQANTQSRYRRRAIPIDQQRAYPASTSRPLHACPTNSRSTAVINIDL